MKTLQLITIFGLIALFYGCCDGLKGTYVGQDGAFIEQMTFTSCDAVELVFMGSTAEGNYTIEGNKVKIVNAGENQILTITDDGCLDGGGFIGKYCKD